MGTIRFFRSGKNAQRRKCFVDAAVLLGVFCTILFCTGQPVSAAEPPGSLAEALRGHYLAGVGGNSLKDRFIFEIDVQLLFPKDGEALYETWYSTLKVAGRNPLRKTVIWSKAQRKEQKTVSRGEGIELVHSDSGLLKGTIFRYPKDDSRFQLILISKTGGETEIPLRVLDVFRVDGTKKTIKPELPGKFAPPGDAKGTRLKGTSIIKPADELDVYVGLDVCFDEKEDTAIVTYYSTTLKAKELPDELRAKDSAEAKPWLSNGIFMEKCRYRDVTNAEYGKGILLEETAAKGESGRTGKIPEILILRDKDQEKVYHALLSLNGVRIEVKLDELAMGSPRQWREILGRK